MQSISLTAIESQRFQIQLEGISCTIKLTQRDTGLFMDLYANGNAVRLGVKCENANRIVRYNHLRSQTGFKGELFFIDTQGELDPDFSELGIRFKLYYLTSEEMSG